MEKLRVITLCGSSRFVDIMAVIAWKFERDQHVIVMGLHLLPQWYAEDIPDHIAEHQGCAKEMDELHLRKIDISDEIFVVNFGGYIGDSTRKEIKYAEKHGKRITYLMEPKQRNEDDMDVRYSTVGGETCQNCGRKYKVCWEAPDELWQKLVGKEEGSLCISCFDAIAAANRIALSWYCTVDKEPND